MTDLYKVLIDGKACHGGDYTYDLPTANDNGIWTPGAWTDPLTDVAICARGYHVTTDPMQWPKIGMQVYATEQRGVSPEQRQDKRVAESIRLTMPRPDLIPDYWLPVETFVASIASVPFLQPQGPPDPAWRMFETRDVAGGAARGAARDVAGEAAWGAAWDAARDAAWDAALLAEIHVCDGLNLDQRHIDHAHARWDVWQRGYGLAREVDGVLCVYRSID